MDKLPSNTSAEGSYQGILRAGQQARDALVDIVLVLGHPPFYCVVDLTKKVKVRKREYIYK